MKFVKVELLYRDEFNFKSSFEVLVPEDDAPHVGDEIEIDEDDGNYHGLTMSKVWKDHHDQYGEPDGKGDGDHNLLDVIDVTILK